MLWSFWNSDLKFIVSAHMLHIKVDKERDVLFLPFDMQRFRWNAYFPICFFSRNSLEILLNMKYPVKPEELLKWWMTFRTERLCAKHLKSDILNHFVKPVDLLPSTYLKACVVLYLILKLNEPFGERKSLWKTSVLCLLLKREHFIGCSQQVPC